MESSDPASGVDLLRIHLQPQHQPDAQVDDDFTSCGLKGVSWTARGTLNFPNFVRRRVFDGQVFWLGNAAGFLEPLEATAICTGVL